MTLWYDHYSLQLIPFHYVYIGFWLWDQTEIANYYNIAANLPTTLQQNQTNKIYGSHKFHLTTPLSDSTISMQFQVILFVASACKWCRENLLLDRTKFEI